MYGNRLRIVLGNDSNNRPLDEFYEKVGFLFDGRESGGQ